MRIPGIPFHQGRNDYTDADGMHYGIAIHNTSNTASDEAESSYADHRTDGTSSHFYVDGDSVIQSLDTNDKAGHAGSREGNDNAIAFEITGTNDKPRQWWLDNAAWSRLGYVIAYILRHDPDYAGFRVRRATVAEMQANPKVKAFYSHNDMRLAWGGTTHDDPGPNFPWDRLFAAVNAALEGGSDMALKDEVLEGTQSAKAGNRNAETALVDLFNGRSLWFGEIKKDDPRYPPIGSPLYNQLEQYQTAPSAPLSAVALAAALAPLLTDHLGVEVGQDALVAALQSEAGQAALVAAANRAEDS